MTAETHIVRAKPAWEIDAERLTAKWLNGECEAGGHARRDCRNRGLCARRCLEQRVDDAIHYGAGIPPVPRTPEAEEGLAFGPRRSGMGRREELTPA
jgi:hypothetical protein